MQLDFRFAEIDYEIWALGQYLDIVERSIPRLSKAERDRLLATLPTPRFSLEDFHFANQAADQIEEDVIPRYLRGSFIIALWAVFEGAVTLVAKYIQHAGNQKLSLADIRGDFLERATKYFDCVIEFPLTSDSSARGRLADLAAVRHVAAHRNCRVDDLDPGMRKRLQVLINSDTDSEEGEFLIIDERFCRSAYETVSSVVRDLLERTRSSYT